MIKASSDDTTVKDIVQQHDSSWHKYEIVSLYEKIGRVKGGRE